MTRHKDTNNFRRANIHIIDYSGFEIAGSLDLMDLDQWNWTDTIYNFYILSPISALLLFI